MNEKPLLRDPDAKPTSALIAECLGAANSAYTKFVSELKKHDIQVDWRYYNDSKAWLGKSLYKWTTSRGTQKEITAFWLSVWDGFFRVGFTFPQRNRAAMEDLPLGREIKKIIENSEQLGKMKVFPLAFDLRSDEMFDDIFTLVEYKKKMK